MHPAYSVILFTTASGAGYGLLFLLGVAAAVGWLPPERGFGIAAFGLGFGAVTFGLLTSTFHLGHPERMWRAFGQWRSSWLSREAVVAVAAYVPAGAFAIGWVFAGSNGGVWAGFGLLGAGLAALAVACTAMIYRSLPTVPRWHNRWVVPNYLALALMTGALLLNALVEAFALAVQSFTTFAAVLVLAGYVLKRLYWRSIDGEGPSSTAGTATGLGRFGVVRQLEAPHTEENFVMREMGYRIARQHARRLRAIASAAAFVAPMLLLAVQAGVARPWPAAPAVLAAVIAFLGVGVERWLFFAEARHVVTLFYGAERA